MMEFNQALDHVDHVVDQVNLEQQVASNLGAMESDAEYLNIKDEPAYELECETETAPIYSSLDPGTTITTIAQSHHSELNPTYCTLPTPDHVSPEVLDIRSRFACLSKVTFPMKLWELLEDGETTLVQWTDNGLAIALDSQGFDEEIQDFFPGEFGDNKLRNFCRQLRVYDFNEVTIRDPNWAMFSGLLHDRSYLRIFYHHFFRRGYPEDLLQIVRVRDIVPRGRSRPKHPRPRQLLPAPTGPYKLGYTPPQTRQRQYVVSPKKRKVAERFGINANTVASHLGPDHPLVTSLLQQTTVKGSSSLEVPTIQGLVDTERSDWTSIVNGDEPVQTETVVTSQEELNAASLGVVLSIPEERSTENKVPHPNIDTSYMTSDSSQDSSDVSGYSLSSREQGHVEGTVIRTSKHLASQPPPATASVTQPSPGFPTPAGSSLVLVPCLRMGEQLLPLSLGGSFSETGISLLQASPDFQNIVAQVRPPCCDKAQQCDGVEEVRDAEEAPNCWTQNVIDLPELTNPPLEQNNGCA